MHGLLAKATLTITDEHMMIGGAVLIGIVGILGIVKWVKMSGKKRAQLFDALLQEVTDRVHGALGAHTIPAQSIENLISQKLDSTHSMIKDDMVGLKSAHRRFTDSVASRAADEIVKKAGVAAAKMSLPAPPANDPGFFKEPALPSKIGDLPELRNRIGSGKVDHLLRESGFGSNASFEEVKQGLLWGTYGPKGNQPLTPVRFVECDTNHLENIVATQAHLNLLQYHVIWSILRDRYLAGGKPIHARQGFPDVNDGPFSA